MLRSGRARKGQRQSKRAHLRCEFRGRHLLTVRKWMAHGVAVSPPKMCVPHATCTWTKKAGREGSVGGL